MIVIGSIRLHMAMVGIQPQQHRSTQSLIVPISMSVTHVKFRCARVEKNTVKGNPKRDIGWPRPVCHYVEESVPWQASG